MKNKINRSLNYLLYLCFCLMAGTGLMLVYRLPPRSRGGGGSVLGLTRHEWGDIHYWVSYAFAAAILLHLWMHRQWLHKVAVRRHNWLLLLGLLLGIALIVIPFFIPVIK